MIKKDGRLIKWFWFQMYECSRVEKFLTDMARKGWMVETFVGNKFTFQPCEPKEVRFSAEIFDESSESNVFQNNATLTYIDYCEKAGWIYVTRDKKIHVFYTTDMDAVSIETDDELTLSIINKNIWKENINNWFIMPLLGILLVKMQIGNYIYFLSNYSSILLILAWLVIIFNAAIGLISYISWYVATKNRIRNSRPLKYYDGKNRSVVKMLNTIFVFAIFGFYNINEFINGNKIIVIGFDLLLVIIIFWVKYVPNKKVINRKKNIIFMQMIVIIVSVVILITAITFSLTCGNSENNSEVFLYYNSGELRLETIKHDEVPITLEDYGIQCDNSASSIRETSAEVNATIFAQDYIYYDNCNSESYDYQNGISYEVFQSDFQWVIDNYLETRWFYSENVLEFTEVDPSEFKADKLYVQNFENGGYQYIAVYGKKVLIFAPDETPTKDQIELFIKTFKFS